MVNIIGFFQPGDVIWNLNPIEAENPDRIFCGRIWSEKRGSICHRSGTMFSNINMMWSSIIVSDFQGISFG